MKFATTITLTVTSNPTANHVTHALVEITNGMTTMKDAVATAPTTVPIARMLMKPACTVNSVYQDINSPLVPISVSTSVQLDSRRSLDSQNALELAIPEW